MVKKSDLLRSLKEDLRASDRLRQEWFNKIHEWRNETSGKPYGNEVKGKSKIVSQDIRKQLEWMLPTLADPFLSTPDIIKCNPVTFEDVLAARQNELILNTQFCRKFPRYNFLMKALKVLATEGTLVVQTGWDYEDEEVDTMVETVGSHPLTGEDTIVMSKEKVTRIKKNQPTAVVCRNEDIYLDPTCMDNMDKCQFVIHRYETDLSTLKADGRYKNLDKVAMEEGAKYDYGFIQQDHTFFKFSDKARKKMLVYEYWGNYDIDEDGFAEPIVCAWIGNTIIRLQSNPYPDKKPPFIVVPFNAVPFQMHGDSLASIIGDNQKVKTAIIRGIIDNMAQSNNAQVGMRKGALDMANRKKFLEGKNFEYNGTPNDFWQGSYNAIPSSVFDILTVMNNEIESQTGVKSFSGGITGSSLGSTATGARGALDATATRRISLVRNIAENLIKPLMRKWMAYNSEFLEEEEIVRITNDEFVPIRRDDLDGNIDIDISISTADDNAAKSQELSFLLQTMGPNQDFEINKMIMAEIARLSRMPELEKQIRAHQPQKDPAEEQAKQLEMAKLQLELELMKADIADKNARAGENVIDAEVKKAKMQVEMAKARKLGSEADGLDLDFLVKNESGIGNDTKDQDKYAHEMNMKMMDRQHKLEDASMNREHDMNKFMMDKQFKDQEAEKNREHELMKLSAERTHQVQDDDVAREHELEKLNRQKRGDK